MAQKYKLIERKNLGKDREETPRKMYAQAVNNGYVSFEELCMEIGEGSTLTSADIKAVMDRMNYTLDKHLKAGRIVQFGEIGSFRLALGSAGSTDTDSFTHALIRKPKIVFTPGGKLQKTRKMTTFERLSEAVVADDDDDRPQEI